jgi:uncharacterized cofD-like protein
VKVVGIGGGHGLARTLRAARLYADEVEAVVTVADDGGSSGRLVRELGIPAPGDIRNCLVALSDDIDLGALFQHRFCRGALAGHALGNLVIAALAEREGDFGRAVERAGELLGAKGRVHPATTTTVSLHARVRNGEINGQVAVARTNHPIQAVYLQPPEPPAYGPAVAAIESADQVVLGPGSLFTSLIATLLVPGLRAALQRSGARRVFVCNLKMQPGETEGLDAAAHVGALLAHVGAYAVDVVLVQVPPLPGGGLSIERAALDHYGLEIVEADLAAADGGHDPARLAEALSALV